MGPKVKFTKEQIVDTAFDIARTEGLKNITMRKIAERMGSSVAPIYVNFKDITELLEAVMERVINVSQQLLREENSGNPFYDMGKASLRFAKEYSVLFRDLVMKSNENMKGYNEKIIPILIEEMQKDPDLEGFNVEELKMILFKMRVFQLGLSVMVANGLLPEEYENEDLMGILSSASNDVVLSAKLRKNKIR